MDTVIESLVAVGREIVVEKKAAEETQRQLENEKIVAEWQALENELRQAFPDAVRTYLSLRRWYGDFETSPDSNLKAFSAEILIPGYMSILVHAKRDEDGKWVQDSNKNQWGDSYTLYRVAGGWDRDYHCWLYTDSLNTDSLEEALYHAWSGGQRKQAEDKALAQTFAKPWVEEMVETPVYEPVYDNSDGAASLINMGELVALVRDIVRDELTQQSK